MTEFHWHNLSREEVAEKLETDLRQGLSETEAADRLEHHGLNQLEEGGRRPLWRMFLEQFRDFMILVLLGAAVISGLIGEAVDTIAILVIVGLNAVIGAVQEYRAEKAMAALKAMAAPAARVRRAGQVIELPAAKLVPGDVVLLQAGAVVPADLRLVESADLEANESMLTGESTGVAKQVESLAEPKLAVAERVNMVFKGSQVNRGRAVGLVVATGMATELGQIARLLQKTVDSKTPLQKRLALFSKKLALVVLAICAVIFVVGLLRGEPVMLMLLTAISLAVAAIPEALPAVISVALALGAARMSKRHALLRNLPAVETLGSVTYICTDKTGTLTQNRMHAEGFYLDGQMHEAIPGQSRMFGEALALNNDVEGTEGDLKGDPTEVALYEAALAHGYPRQELEERLPRVAEFPFDAERKRMSTLHRDEDGIVLFCKGAPERLLPLCTGGEVDGLLAQAESLAGEGYRVLAVASRQLPELPEKLEMEEAERDLTFLGLVALIDPPREEAPQAVQDCLSAGIVPVMITGDHPATALAIAKRLGMAESEEQLITGQELAELEPEELRQRARQLRVYARTSPEQKIRIVEALQDLGEFCAMTGDGVNDAPALKKADIGVAMGDNGTDVAREASDMVLLDDNFASITAAVREGRRIFDNIRKFIRYTMTSNSGEIWVLFLAPFMGLPIPLLPIHILWINLVTDGLPGLALTAEKAEPGVMQRPPRAPDESIFAHGMWQHMVWVGLLIGGLSLAAMGWAYGNGHENWQTIVFTVLTFCQLAHVLVIRSETESLWRLGLFSNRPLLGAVALTVLLQLGVIYLPLLNDIFKTAPLTLPELALCCGLPLLVLGGVELEKWWRRRQLSRQV